MADRYREPSAGELIHRVVWNKRTIADAVDGSSGQELTTFPPQGTYWAKVVPAEGSQVFNAEQLKPIRIHRVTLRGGSSRPIAAGDQLVFQGRPLTVDSVRRVEERGFWLEITAIEQAQGVAGGP